MKKQIRSIAISVICCFLLTACGGNSKDTEGEVTTDSQSTENSSSIDTNTKSDVDIQTEINVGVLKGPTAMGMVKLMDDSDNDATETNNYNFSIVASVDEVTPRIVQGEYDIAAVPANVASILYNNDSVDISVLAVNTLGVLYIVENGNTIQSVEDLRGKTIYASGKGATPEYALNYMLSANGIDPSEDVTIEYKTEHSECVSAIAATEGGVAMLPQPFVTVAATQNPDIRVALDMTEEWEEVSGATLITGVIIARNDFIEDNTEAVELFLEQYEASVDYVNSNTEEAANLIGNYGIIDAEVAKKALPDCNICFISGEEMKEKLGAYLDILYQQNSASIGESIPDESFYYIQ